MPVTSNISLIEDYLSGLRNHDLSGVAFAPDVQFEGPSTDGPLVGEHAVRNYLAGTFPATLGICIKRHVSEGEYVVTQFDLQTPQGVVPVLDLFHVVDGRIRAIRPYFDPAPLRMALADKVQP